MKVFLILIAVLILSQEKLFPQSLSAYDDYNKRNYKTQRSMHLTLGSWALINFAGSAALIGKADTPFNDDFYRMNIYWNVINAGIAGIALAHLPKKDFNIRDSLTLVQGQKKIERLMLTNACLDVLYIGSGLLMDAYSHRLKKNPELLDGFGKSFVLQGGFLLLFDTTFYLLYKNNGDRFSESQLSFSAAPGGLGLKYTF